MLIELIQNSRMLCEREFSPDPLFEPSDTFTCGYSNIAETSINNYCIVTKFGGDNGWRKWIDKDLINKLIF